MTSWSPCSSVHDPDHHPETTKFKESSTFDIPQRFEAPSSKGKAEATKFREKCDASHEGKADTTKSEGKSVTAQFKVPPVEGKVTDLLKWRRTNKTLQQEKRTVSP